MILPTVTKVVWLCQCQQTIFELKAEDSVLFNIFSDLEISSGFASSVEIILRACNSEDLIVDRNKVAFIAFGDLMNNLKAIS